jgi:hypothetical protein
VRWVGLAVVIVTRSSRTFLRDSEVSTTVVDESAIAAAPATRSAPKTLRPRRGDQSTHRDREEDHIVADRPSQITTNLADCPAIQFGRAPAFVSRAVRALAPWVSGSSPECRWLRLELRVCRPEQAPGRAEYGPRELARTMCVPLSPHPNVSDCGREIERRLPISTSVRGGNPGREEFPGGTGHRSIPPYARCVGSCALPPPRDNTRRSCRTGSRAR